jgi:hypothetical protein
LWPAWPHGEDLNASRILLLTTAVAMNKHEMAALNTAQAALLPLGARPMPTQTTMNHKPHSTDQKMSQPKSQL